MSVYSLVFLGTVPIGNAVMGFVADMVGTPRAVTASGVICLLAAGVFARRYLAKQDGV
jgi:hypothetical protein